MSSAALPSVLIQASPEPVPAVPTWFGEVTLIARSLKRQGVLAAIEEQVRFPVAARGSTRERYSRHTPWLRSERRTNAGSLLRTDYRLCVDASYPHTTHESTGHSEHTTHRFVLFGPFPERLARPLHREIADWRDASTFAPK